MARIPTIESEAGLPNAGGIVPAYVDQTGRGLMALGEGLGHTADQIEAKLKQRKTEEENLWVAKQAAMAQGKWTSELTNRKINAPDGAPGFTQQFSTDFDQDMSSMLGQAPSDEARQRLEIHLLNLRTSYESDAQVFESNARIDKRVLDLDEGVRSAGAALLQDPMNYEDTYDMFKMTIDEAKSTIPEAKRRELYKKLDDLTEATIYGITNKNPKLALKMIDSGAFNGKMDPVRLAAMRNAVESKTQEVDQLARYAADQQANDVIAFVQQNGYLPEGVSVGSLAAAGGGQADIIGARAAELNNKVMIAQKQFEIVNTMRGMSPSERTEYLNSLNPKDRFSKNYSEDLTLFTSALQYADTLNELTTKDPYMLTQLDDSPISMKSRLDEAWTNLSEGASPENAAALQEELQNALNWQRHQGVQEGNLAIMSNEMASARVTELKGMNAEEATQALAQDQNTYGPLFPIYLRNLDKQGLPKDLTIAMSLGGTQGAQDLVDASRMKPEDLTSFMAGPDATNMDNAIRSHPSMMAFTSALTNTPGMGGKEAADTKNAIEKLARYYYIKDNNHDVSGAVNKAMDSVLNYKFSFPMVNGKTLLLPKFMNGLPVSEGFENDVVNGLDDYLGTAVENLKADPYLFKELYPGVPETDMASKVGDLIRTNGFWVTNNDATGAMLYVQGLDGRPYEVRDKNKKPISVTFTQAVQHGVDLFMMPGNYDPATGLPMP